MISNLNGRGDKRAFSPEQYRSRSRVVLGVLL